MRSLDDVFKKLEKEKKEIIETQKIETNKINKKYESEIGRLKKEITKLEKAKKYEHSNLNKKYYKLQDEIKNKFYIKSAKALEEDLNKDHNLLETISKYRNNSEKEIEEAKIIKEILKNQNNSYVQTIIKNLNSKMKSLVEDKEIIDINEKKEIFSYIFNDSNKTYILLPTKKDNKKNEFAKILENQFLDFLNFLDKNKKLIENPNFDYAKNYLLIKIETKQPEQIKKILLERLNNNRFTPKILKEKNVFHHTKELKKEIFDIFTEKKENDLSENKNPSQYKILNEKYKKLSIEYGKNPTRTELNQKGGDFRKLWEEIKKYEKEQLNGKRIDFLPRKNSKNKF